MVVISCPYTPKLVLYSTILLVVIWEVVLAPCCIPKFKAFKSSPPCYWTNIKVFKLFDSALANPKAFKFAPFPTWLANSL